MDNIFTFKEHLKFGYYSSPIGSLPQATCVPPKTLLLQCYATFLVCNSFTAIINLYVDIDMPVNILHSFPTSQMPLQQVQF